MRKLFTISLAVLLVLSCCLFSAGAHARKSKKPIIIEAMVLDMSPVIGHGRPSGIVPHYRLVRYKVERVCKGKYAGNEIVIDHSMPGDDELKDVKVGDRVYVLFTKGKKEGTVHTYKGLRDTTEGLKHVYRAWGVLAVKSPGCAFDEREFLALH